MNVSDVKLICYILNETDRVINEALKKLLLIKNLNIQKKLFEES